MQDLDIAVTNVKIVQRVISIQSNIINRDYNFDDIGELNKCMAFEKEVILNVNIRLDANFNN